MTFVKTTKSTEKDKLICLTFDDGPSTNTMDALMDVLSEYGAKATFFVVGNKIGANLNCQNALKRAVREGHEIANHSWSHQSMDSMGTTEILKEIDDTQARVQEVASVTMKYFRPPNLAVSNILFTTVALPFVTMSVDTMDYSATASAKSIYEAVVAGAKDGAIILQHCYEENDKTVEALQMILAWCEENGYKPVTVSEMFEAKNIIPKNGKVYRSSTQIHQNELYQ